MTNETKYEVFCHPLYLAMAGGLSLPAMAFGILGYESWCPYYSGWLAADAGLSLMNMLAALYIVYKIRRISHPEPTQDVTESNENPPKEDVEGGSCYHESTGDGSTEQPQTDASQRPGFLKRLLRRRTTSSDRIRHLLCYDGVVATYSILFLFWVVWLSEGSQRVKTQGTATKTEWNGCLPYHERYMQVSIICGFSYFAFITLSLLASLWR